MKNITSSFIKEFIKVVIIVAIAVPTIALFAAWTGPTGAPPTNNAAAPVNVGANDQIKKYEIDGLGNLIPGKSGGLVVGTFFSRFGTLLATDGGNVGIGIRDWATNPPVAKLEIVGGVKLGDTTSCIDGIVKYDGDFKGCKAGVWVSLTAAGGVSGGEQLFDTPGTYTFTTPPGITTVRVTMGGGGGGGGGGGSGRLGGGGFDVNGVDGGDSSFGSLLTARKGFRGISGTNSGYGGAGGYSYDSFALGGRGSSGAFAASGINMGGVGGVGGCARDGSCGGRGGDGESDINYSGGGGGGGGGGGEVIRARELTLTPSTNYSVIVGAGGGSVGGRSGAPGFVRIEW